MTTTPDEVFEDFALCLISLVDTNGTVARDEILNDAERCIDSIGDDETRGQMMHILRVVSRNTPR